MPSSLSCGRWDTRCSDRLGYACMTPLGGCCCMPLASPIRDGSDLRRWLLLLCRRGAVPAAVEQRCSHLLHIRGAPQRCQYAVSWCCVCAKDGPSHASWMDGSALSITRQHRIGALPRNGYHARRRCLVRLCTLWCTSCINRAVQSSGIPWLPA